MRNWEKSNQEKCSGKKAFLTWKQATTENNRITKHSGLRAKGRKIERLHVYKCTNCGLFHLGHAARRRREGKSFRPRLSELHPSGDYRKKDKPSFAPGRRLSRLDFQPYDESPL